MLFLSWEGLPQGGLPVPIGAPVPSRGDRLFPPFLLPYKAKGNRDKRLAEGRPGRGVGGRERCYRHRQTQ